jgi:hypothetical protein
MPDTDDAEVQGMPIPRRAVQRGRDANAEGCDTEQPGMKISSESDADADAE